MGTLKDAAQWRIKNFLVAREGVHMSEQEKKIPDKQIRRKNV